MIKQLIIIASAEWLYWLRSKLVIGVALVFLVLFTSTSFLTAIHISTEKDARIHHQTQAEETFLSQPDRHPHRMVHYGHYLFRTPAPLASFDIGLDAVTGKSIFLEGHRHNTVMFAESAASADFGGLSWLSPALVYQLFAPLVIILLGHNSIARERETAVLAPLLAMGINGIRLLMGKVLALFLFIILLLVPLIVSCSLNLSDGENINILLSLFGVYFIYLAVWTLLSLIASTLIRKGTTVLAVMAGLWFIICLALPSVAVNIVSESSSLAGKIENDLNMQADIRKIGNSHNANDPAFKQLRADILKKYKVDRIEDLPVNFRGLVSMEGETKLSKVLNDYAEKRMEAELRQERQIENYGWLTPALAIAFASRSIAGTDLVHYHRFQREAETVRFNFVQGLNRVHFEKLSYQDDMNRNKDEASWQRARVDASNWQVLDSYQFQTAPASQRLVNAFFSIQILVIWLAVLLIISILCATRIKP